MREFDREIVGAFIVSSDEKVLLGYSGTFEGKYVVPGGGIEPGESNLEAVNREIFEETGINIAEFEVVELPDRDYCNGTSEKTQRDTGERVLVHMKFTDFLVRIPKLSGEIEVILNDDFTKAIWMGTSELAINKFSTSIASRLKELGYLK